MTVWLPLDLKAWPQFPSRVHSFRDLLGFGPSPALSPKSGQSEIHFVSACHNALLPKKTSL
jgi:hypothetical protein